MPTGRLCISLTTRRQTTATLFPYTTLFRSIFPDEILRFARNGAELFVNISDDAWYGDYGAPGQHLNMARMRAIENGRRSEEHTSELQSRRDLVCRLLLEKKKSIKEF